MDNIIFKKVLGDEELFDQQANYEENFEKINQLVVPQITDLETNKVDKVAGKGLSTNDYTTTEKNKLAGIPADTAAQLADKVQNFKIKNEVVNGDFSQGTTGWQSTYANTTINESGRLAITATNQYGYRGQQVPTIVGNKYYFAGTIEGTTNNYLVVRGIGATLKPLPSNGIHRLSGDFVATEASHIISAGDDRTSGWTKFWVDNVIIINLTTTFGAGNEPSKSQIDELMKVIPNGWWDGELSLTQKQFITWQLNLIRKNTNAIIALGGTIV